MQQIQNNATTIDGVTLDWVGQGGFTTNDPLVQTGVEYQETTYIDAYDAFVEDAPSQNVNQVFGVSVGDEIYAEAQTNFVFIEDFNNGHEFSTSESPSADSHYSDCIHEWAKGLIDIHTNPTTFYDCTAVDANNLWVQMGSNNLDGYQQDVCVNTYIDYTPSSPPNQGNFTVYWDKWE